VVVVVVVVVSFKLQSCHRRLQSWVICADVIIRLPFRSAKLKSISDEP
jgi:hypothetical protein